MTPLASQRRKPRAAPGGAARAPWRRLVPLALAAALTACSAAAPGPASAPHRPRPQPPSPQDGQAPSAPTCAAPTKPACRPPPRALAELGPAEVLLLGELHDAPSHQAIERAVVQVLAQQGRLAALAMEMAEAGRSTAGLPRDADDAQIRAALAWNDRGWPWRAYGPVVRAAVAAGVPVIGANLPSAALQDAMKNTALDDHLAAGAAAKQYKAIIDGHCGLLGAAQVPPMARVQTARDATMARSVLAARKSGRVVLLVAGSGHVDAALGVPTHLPPGVAARSIVLAAATEIAGSGDGASRTQAADGGVHTQATWLTDAAPAKDYCAELREQ
ncbi:MAG: ChaN family lipoprotein [Burkholderiaceae bacterium]|nr:MAG: ChaN family lipoprotein [Burkholderiaceae bacterium]